MPAFRPDQLLTRTSDGVGHPCGPHRVLRLSDTGDLTQFGALIEILPPGSSSALKHWHSHEDELVHILAGTVDLHEGDRITPLHPGDTATFRAGDPVGHCLVNSGTAEARYLIVGTRAATDTVTYPDADRVQHIDRTTGTRRWTDLSGAPASDAYRPD